MSTGASDGLEAHLPEAQQLLVEQRGPAAPTRGSSRARRSRRGPLMICRNTCSRSASCSVELVDRDALPRAARASSRSSVGVVARGRSADAAAVLRAARAAASAAGSALGDERARCRPAKRDSRFCVRVERDDRARLEHRDAAAQRLGFLEVVRGQDDRVAVAVQLADELPTGSGAARRRRRRSARRARSPAACAPAPAPTSTRRFMPPDSARMLASAFDGEVEVVQDLVDPGVVVAHAEVAGLDAQASRARVKNGSNTSSCGTTPSMRRARAVVARRRRGPGCARVPRSARARPARMEISVVLPAPLGPSRPKNSPSSTARLDAGERLHAPKRRATSTTSTAAVMASAVIGTAADATRRATSRAGAASSAGEQSPRRRRARPARAAPPGTLANASGLPLAAPRAASAPAAPRPPPNRPRSTPSQVDDAVAGSGSARAASSTGPRVGERQRAGERPAPPSSATTKRRRSAGAAARTSSVTWPALPCSCRPAS